jgi:beta-glucosidase/6-phospho-beta-glucosidase/beta-galactosidase
MRVREGIFPTFFLSGFETSTFVWKDQGRRDLAAETQHRGHVREDYELLRRLGIGVAREGIPWPFVDRGGACDFSLVDPILEALNETKVVAIWDLCHYGYPDDVNPFADDFATRFARYARAAAEHVVPRTPEPRFFSPINEITFFAFAGAEWGWTAPFLNTVQDRKRFRLALCEASIAAVNAIREVDPNARMVHIDPLVHVVAPRDRPDLVERARQETYDDTFVAWDVIAGKRHPEFGGSPETLDIVGVNCYSFGQMEFREHGPHAALGATDDRIESLCDMLEYAWNRYRRPMIIAETSGLGKGRPAWLKDVTEETLAAIDRGADFHGICLFPAVDMPNWHTGEWLHNGICDLIDDGGPLRRAQYGPYVDELRRWQKLFNRVTELDEDPLSDPVDLGDVVAAAERLHEQPDRDWS